MFFLENGWWQCHNERFIEVFSIFWNLNLFLCEARYQANKAGKLMHYQPMKQAGLLFKYE